jgi:hypothetical protein
MSRIATSCVIVMLCGSFAMGEVGDLTYMKNPQFVRSGARIHVSTFKHAGADKAKGLVSEHSVVGEPRGGGVKIAIDSSKAGATQPDLIRLDFSGKGMFKDAPTASIKMRPARGKYTTGTIGRVVVSVKRDGRSVPVTIQGSYWKQTTRRGLSLTMSAALEGECKFGDKTYPVRVLDGNGNLKFSDALKPPYRSSSTMAFDRIQVGTDGGKFSSSAVTSFVGQPIIIDGRLYNVDVSGMKITARAMEIAAGSIKVNAPRWTTTLIGKKYFLTLSGGKAPLSVPADEYRTANYTVFAGADPRKRCATISGNGSVRGGKAFTVAPGQTADVKLGAPIEATISSSNNKGKVRMNLMMKDALGGRIRSITTDAGKRPPAPSIEVVDKAGKIVYTAKLKYG